MTEGERYRPRLLWALRRGAGDFYDRLGLTVLGSVLLAIPAAVILPLGSAFHPLLPAGLLILVQGIAIWCLSALAWGVNVLIAHRIAYLEAPGPDAVRDFLSQRWAPALKLAIVQLVVTSVMLTDVLFFVSRRTWATQLTGIVTGYILFLWLMTMLWQWPFFVLEGGPTLKIIKKSALVLMDNPFFTLGAFVVTITLSIALTATGIGAVAVVGGLMSCFLVRAHREVLKKYELVEDEPDEVEDPGWPGTTEPPRRLHPRDMGPGRRS